MSICLALENDYGPVQWRCNLVAGHYPETPHAYIASNVTHHEWVDE